VCVCVCVCVWRVVAFYHSPVAAESESHNEPFDVAA
jgi:hypothetical protein